jgi:CMP-N-acetylneuraminic acid synthetase
MKICVIPARGGSKKISRKNIREFNGKPVFAYPMQATIESGLFDEVVVSTDDAQLAKKYGVKTPFLRPEHLANVYAATAPQRSLKICPEGGVNPFYPEFTKTGTQDLGRAFCDADMFYFCDAQVHKQNVSMHSSHAQPYVFPRHLVHDIDDESDWDFSEKMFVLVNNRLLGTKMEGEHA